jgi:hypothetical protein
VLPKRVTRSLLSNPMLKKLQAFLEAPDQQVALVENSGSTHSDKVIFGDFPNVPGTNPSSTL